MRKHTTMLALMATLCALLAQAAPAPAGYYSRAEGKNKQALLSALFNIIKSHTNVGYDGLWDAYKQTDVYTQDGKQYYYDLYSNYPFEVGTKENKSYSKIGDGINREHMVPQSWFNSASPMKSDLFHVIPTDGYVNNQRSNYPYGECANGTRLKNGQYYGRGKKGTCTTPGYTGTVWEPDDDIKGDCARAYFYMATCYNDKIGNWNSQSASAVFAGNSYPGFTDWYLTMMLRWHKMDPVDQREIDRNNAGYDVQNNRNPYIDHPELADYVWGECKDLQWSETAEPVLSSPADGESYIIEAAQLGTNATLPIAVSGRQLTQDLAVSVSGEGFEVSTTVITARDATWAPPSPLASTPALWACTRVPSLSRAARCEPPAPSLLWATDTVTQLTATANSATSLTATWNAAQGASAYTLRVTAVGGTQTPIHKASPNCC